MRAVGELLENQYRIGLVRMERAIKERMSLQEIEALMPHDLINAKPVTAVIKEFFGSSQLSQFMDQTNPLSEVTHKRRLSALGPGGLTRERAGFEVRDVHPTHYGRICPIETPEGPNIGLIASLSTFARVNEFGFVETPYRKVEDGKVRRTCVLLGARGGEAHHRPGERGVRQEGQVRQRAGSQLAAAASSSRRGRGHPADGRVAEPARVGGRLADPVPRERRREPRAHGLNMQRQAVPLLRTFAPLVGTGIEGKVAQDSGVTLSPGVPASSGVDASRIVVQGGRAGVVDGHRLRGRHLQPHQVPALEPEHLHQPEAHRPKGDKVKKGDVIADGPATETASSRSGRTWSSRSCRGRATTSRTRS